MAALSSIDYEYRRTENSVSSINYHFVFVPKRRRPILIKDVARRLQEIIFELVTEHNWKLIALEIQPDHVHMFLNTPTDEAPSQIAKWVKRMFEKSLVMYQILLDPPKSPLKRGTLIPVPPF